jgi:hypothetical protein
MFGLGCLCVLGLTAFLGSSASPVGAAEHFPGQGFLPDNRAWEMVSPPDKNGGDVMPATNRTRIAADGSAASFTSLVGFGDTHGGTIGAEYLAQRTAAPETSGWATHGITPREEALPFFGAFFALDPNYDGEMSDDLSHGVYRSYRPLTDDPNVAGLQNLYVRDDLRSPGEGSYRPLTDPGFQLPVPETFPSVARPWLAGASSDFSKVIFESQVNLTTDGQPGQVKLYESEAGAPLRLAGMVPPPGQTECDDVTEAPACEEAPSSQAGQGAQGANNFGLPASTPRMISADGSRIFFQTPVESGNVYMRVDGTRTVQLNASERTDCADHDPCTGTPEPDPSGPQPASLWIASKDGSRIFFSTSEGLVNEDADGLDDIYMYDVDAPAGRHLTLVTKDEEPSTGDGVIGVVGASDDGHYLYFMVGGQLVAGEPAGRGLYAWHDGTIKYIGGFDVPDNVTLNTLAASWTGTSITLMARVAADGSHLMFATSSDGGFKDRWGFAGFDHAGPKCGVGCRELYVFDANAGTLRCASCDPSGALPLGAAQDNIKNDATASGATSTSHITRALSSDGRYAFFSSPDPLVPEDTNGKYDAYEYDTQTEEVHLLSSGESPEDSYFMDASASGDDAFFATREQLTGWDLDTSYDLYDARAGGGLPEPKPAPPSCQGDACQPTPQSLNDPTPSSSAYAGPGNADRARKRHKRHQAKKRHRRHARHAAQKRHANANRGGSK